jgi:hypothetical protein
MIRIRPPPTVPVFVRIFWSSYIDDSRRRFAKRVRTHPTRTGLWQPIYAKQHREIDKENSHMILSAATRYCTDTGSGTTTSDKPVILSTYHLLSGSTDCHYIHTVGLLRFHNPTLFKTMECGRLRRHQRQRPRPRPTQGATQIMLQLMILCLAGMLLSWDINAFIPHSIRSRNVGWQKAQRSHEVPLTFRDIEFGVRASGSEATNDITAPSLEIVLFGLGDLRISDHEGLVNACAKLSSPVGGANSKIVPLFLLKEEYFGNFPGAANHALDTALMVSSALKCLRGELESVLGLELQFCEATNVATCIENIAAEASKAGLSQTNVHTCDLGAADTSMKYNPFSSLDSASSSKFNICDWQCNLRSKPFENVADVPSSYPEYQEKYCATVQAVASPLEAPSQSVAKDKQFNIPDKFAGKTSFPEQEDLLSMILHKNRNDASATFPSLMKLEEDAMTGLFGTHWGGYNPNTCNEEATLELLSEYVSSCQLSDGLLMKNEKYMSNIKNNPRSLEHCSIGQWQSNGFTQSKALIDGELMVRALAAPLQLGCISNRQLKQFAQKGLENESKKELWFEFLAAKSNPLNDLAESREWHRVFANKCIMDNKKTETTKSKGELKYKYWRWQGFLCRYGVTFLSEESVPKDPASLVLIHGFGASGSQWEGMISEIASHLPTSGETNKPEMVFAPDLIGFGQCEKPYISYTQYMWEAFSTDFIKDVVLEKYGCISYAVGGNSIGGYTAMGCAADDTVTLEEEEGDKLTVTSNGAPGSGRCSGLILMNSAGPILSEKDIEKVGPSISIAETTARMGLPPCRYV